MSDRLLKESDVLRIAFQLPLVVNSAFADAVKALPSADRPLYISDVCRSCSNHPSNGGPGICNCTLGSVKVKC